MKKKFNIKAAILSITCMGLLSSCLKDNSHYVDFAGSKPLVELPAATGVGPSGGEFLVYALPIASTPTPINVAVNLAAPKALSTALTVKLSVDQAALTAYNTANGTSFLLLPAADYSSSLSVTIPAGQNLANVVVNVNTSLIDPSQQYALPLTITDGGGQQISNYKTILLNVQAKNQYDGTYTDNGYALRSGDPVLTGNFKGVSVTLATAGAASVKFTQFWGDGATVVGGINPVTLTLNTTTNAVAISSNSNATLTNALGYNSRYDPATKTFYVSFAWNTPGTRAATDTLVYTGP